MPVVGLGPQLEQWRRDRASDLDDADLHPEEPVVLAAEFVDVVQRLAVLFAGGRGEPHDGPGVGAAA